MYFSVLVNIILCITSYYNKSYVCTQADKQCIAIYITQHILAQMSISYSKF